MKQRILCWAALVCALLFAAAGICLAFMAWPTYHGMMIGELGLRTSSKPRTLSALLALPSAELSQVDIVRMNLLCAKGLSETETLDVEGQLSVLDQWSRRVASETERHLYRFKHNPAEFEHSEGFFRMLILAVVLSEDFGVHYNPARQVAPEHARAWDAFFAQSHDVFLHGLLGPRRQGTCSSLPVLYVAVGRRLGYPLKLATTRGHLFVRWEGAGERFNVEVTGQGLNRFPDEYYRHWPFEVSEKEAQAEGYLRSLSPREELAVFLSIRAMCLREAGRWSEAGEAFATAARLAPGVASYRMMAEHCRSEAATEKTTKLNGENS